MTLVAEFLLIFVNLVGIVILIMAPFILFLWLSKRRRKVTSQELEEYLDRTRTREAEHRIRSNHMYKK